MTSAIIGSRLKRRRRIALIRIAQYFVNLDMPDPATNWRQMLACVGFVALIGVVFIAALLVLP